MRSVRQCHQLRVWTEYDIVDRFWSLLDSSDELYLTDVPAAIFAHSDCRSNQIPIGACGDRSPSCKIRGAPQSSDRFQFGRVPNGQGINPDRDDTVSIMAEGDR